MYQPGHRAFCLGVQTGPLSDQVHQGTGELGVFQYEREKMVYERLGDAAVSIVLGFNVPQLVGSDDGLRVLEITIVERPFVLDFAGAYLDSRPQFPEEVWAGLGGGAARAV